MLTINVLTSVENTVSVDQPRGVAYIANTSDVPRDKALFYGPFELGGDFFHTYGYSERLVGDRLTQKKGIYNENFVTHKETKITLAQEASGILQVVGSGLDSKTKNSYHQGEPVSVKCSSGNESGGNRILYPSSMFRGSELAKKQQFVSSLVCPMTHIPNGWRHTSLDLSGGIMLLWEYDYTVVSLGPLPQPSWPWNRFNDIQLNLRQTTRLRSWRVTPAEQREFTARVDSVYSKQWISLADIYNQISGYSPKGELIEDYEYSKDDVPGYSVLVTSTKETNYSHPSEVIRAMHNMSKYPFYEAGIRHLELDSIAELAMKAVTRLDANSVNMIAFIRDLKDIKSLIPKLKNLASLSTWSNNYLAINYGVLPTVSDLQGILAAFRKAVNYDINGFRTVSAGQTVSTAFLRHPIVATRRCKLAVSNFDSGLSELENKLRNIGLFPSLQNLWDLVPYSFVIDWFVDVGSLLERIDTNGRLARLPIEYVTVSNKIVVDLSQEVVDKVSTLDDSFVVYPSEQVYYHRYVQKDVPRTSSIKYDGSVTAQEHLLEGSALIYQRLHK